jgi:hypothetical protein
MSYAPGSPRSIWALVGLSDGAKLTCMHWWGKADHDAQQSARPCTVWAPARFNDDGSKMTPTESLYADLREGVHPGKADRTLRDHIREITDAGLASVDGRCVDLVPPALAVPVRRKSAKIRRKSAGENPPESGGDLPDVGENPPDIGENPPSHSYPPVPSNLSPVPPITSAPGVTPPDTGTPPAGLSPGCEPAPPSSKPTRKRKPGQTALDIGETPEPDDIAELLDLHGQLRSAAQRAHGLRETPLPASTSGDGRSLRLRLRKAVAEHGADACRRALERRAAEWRDDPVAVSRWSTDSVWSPKSLAVSMSKPSANGQRAGPSRTLPVEPNAPDRTYHWQDEP